MFTIGRNPCSRSTGRGVHDGPEYAAGDGRRARGAGAQVNVFANISNVLNRVNFERVSGALTSTRFGQPTRAGDPREIEIGVRFQF